MSIERRQLLEVFGAEIVSTPGGEGSNGAVRRARAMAEEHPEWCFLYQYGNDANPRAHYEGTGPEIWRDCPEITHFVAGLGTSGTLMGVGRYLKEQNPDIKVMAVEPPVGEAVEGLRNLDEGFIPPVYEMWHGTELLDGKRIVRPRESLEWTRRMADVGVFSGISAGAALAGAARVAERIDEGVIVYIVCDGGWKYLSTGAWTDDLDEVEERAEEDHLLLTAGSLGRIAARLRCSCHHREPGGSPVASRGGRRPSDRDVRQRVRRPHRCPGRHRPASRRASRVHRRHRSVPVRAPSAARGARLRAARSGAPSSTHST